MDVCAPARAGFLPAHGAYAESPVSWEKGVWEIDLVCEGLASASCVDSGGCHVEIELKKALSICGTMFDVFDSGFLASLNQKDRELFLPTG